VCAAEVLIIADDLARIVDAYRSGARRGRGIVQCGVGATAVKEAVLNARAVKIRADDLAGVVDASCNGVGAASAWNGEGSESAIAVQKTLVVAVGVAVIPDDLARIVDAKGRVKSPLALMVV
jgi:hypothetical protein